MIIRVEFYFSHLFVSCSFIMWIWVFFSFLICKIEALKPLLFSLSLFYEFLKYQTACYIFRN